MTKSFAIVVMLTLFVIYSCQKEIDWGITGNLIANQQLVKISSKTGTDSSIVMYTYDNQNRLIKELTVGISGGTVIDNSLTINRNAAGIILHTIQRSPALVTAGVDSLRTVYYYNTSTSNYTSSVFSISAFGLSVIDSAVYTYDVNSRITSELHYLKTGILPPLPGLKNVYTYSANGLNLTGVDQLSATTPGGPLSPVSSQTFSFDTKANPLIIKNEAILLSRPGLFNANNNSKLVLTSAASPAANFTQDYTYVYNPYNKPDSSFAARIPGGVVTASKYFYQ